MSGRGSITPSKGVDNRDPCGWPIESCVFAIEVSLMRAALAKAETQAKTSQDVLRFELRDMRIRAEAAEAKLAKAVEALSLAAEIYADHRSDAPLSARGKRLRDLVTATLAAIRSASCEHVWGTDGAHSNEYCKRCFVNREVGT